MAHTERFCTATSECDLFLLLLRLLQIELRNCRLVFNFDIQHGFRSEKRESWRIILLTMGEKMGITNLISKYES